MDEPFSGWKFRCFVARAFQRAARVVEFDLIAQQLNELDTKRSPSRLGEVNRDDTPGIHGECIGS